MEEQKTIDISSYIESIVCDVFMTMLTTEIKKIDGSFSGNVEVSVFLGIAGKRKYIVLIEAEEDFALKSASCMLMEEINEWSDAVSDAFGEIANMIAGNIKSKLPSELELSLSLPAVVRGKNYTYSTPKMKEITSVIFEAFGGKKMAVKIFEEV